MRFPFRLNANREFDCIGFGENAYDHLLVANRFPRPDTKTPLKAHTEEPGGQIASAMVGVARLGHRTSYVGRFGTDEAGRRSRESLVAEGVDDSHAETIDGARTHTSYIIVDEAKGTRTILYHHDQRLDYDDGDAPLDIAKRARVLHLDAQNPRAALPLARAARAAGVVVSADFDTVTDDVLALAHEVDVLIASADFPRLAVGMMEEADEYRDRALRDLHARFGCAVVGCTLGARGAVVMSEGMYAETDALPVPGGVRDTTGAGDAFHAGFIHGLLAGEGMVETLRIAAAVAALKCREPGARAGLPTLNELQDYLRTLG